jgi:hypothetical protein
MPGSSQNTRNVRKRKFLEAYKKTFDKSKALTCIRAHRSTIMRWAREDADFRQAIIDTEESMLDMAEGELMKQVKNGNMSAIQFLLKSKGKSRGYAPTLSIEQNVKKESIDIKRIEIFMSATETRKALEVLANSSLQEIKDKENEQQQIESRNT